jgi:hypothetical protein
MRQRGRKSAEILSVPNAAGRPSRLDPPDYLSKPAKTVFNDIVMSVDAEHFRECDVPLIASLAHATLMARTMAKNPTKIDQWEKAVRTQAMLSTRLRLTPQSRIDPKTVGRKPHVRTGPLPWDRRS